MGSELAALVPPPGQRQLTSIPVTRMATGAPLDLTVHAIAGVRPGPKLLLLGGLHGDETASVDVLRRVLYSVDPSCLSGTLLIVPVANPPAFEGKTRNTPQDMIDLNRVFPGSASGWLTERIAARLAELVPQVDCIVDYHSGPIGLSIHYSYLGVQTDVKLTAQVRALAVDHGLEMLYAGPLPAGSLGVYANSLGVVSFAAMVGGDSRLAPSLEGELRRSAINLMKHLGMLPGRPDLPERQWLIRDRQLIRTTVGGLFEPLIGPEGLTKVYPHGTPLGRIFDPSTLEELEVLRAPLEENALLMLRGVASSVHPGDYAYIVAEMKTAEPIHESERLRAELATSRRRGEGA